MRFSTKINMAAMTMAAVLVIGGIGISSYVAAADGENPATQPDVSTRGRIAKIEGNDLTLHALRGHSGMMRPVKLSDKTIVILSGGKRGAVGDLKPDQWIKVTFAEKTTDNEWLNAVRIDPAIAPSEEEKLIAKANEEAKTAYRKQSGLAADAYVGDFDHARKPDGVIYDHQVEVTDNGWRVILTKILPTPAQPQLIIRAEVSLDKAGKLSRDVKFEGSGRPAVK